jgi:hypothetical protein
LTTDTTDSTAVILAEPDVLFEAQVWHSTAASAVTARSQIGDSFAIKVAAATDIDGIDIETAAAATDQCNIIDYSRKDTLAAQDGRLIFKINQDAYYFNIRKTH